MTTLYDFKVKTIDHNEITLESYRGKILLIVNVASQCGFTPQYEGLETLYQKYKDQGLVVLGFPCNQFGSQEPGPEAEIKSFCETKFNVTFPLFSKISVNGPEAHPLYEFLKKEEKGIFGTEAIKWNFTKFLVDKEGKTLKRFAPQVLPSAIEKEVVKLLQSEK
jgi:glutathione peroxidase